MKELVVSLYRQGHTMSEITNITGYTAVHRVLHATIPSDEMKVLVKERMLGSKNPNYKRGVYYTAGYKYILAPVWYTGKVCGRSYVAEHHTVLLPHLGLTELPKDTVVHHVDGDKLNNDIANLVLMDDTYHRGMHLTRTMKGIN